MTTLSLSEFKPELLTKIDHTWETPVGECTSLLYDGQKVALLKLPEALVKYGCQDYKGNEKYTMTLDLDTDTQEQIKRVEKRLAELFESEVSILNGKDQLKVKMDQDKDGSMKTLMWDKNNEQLVRVASSIPPNSTIKSAIHIKSVFRQKGTKACYPQVYMKQVKVLGSVRNNDIVECVF